MIVALLVAPSVEIVFVAATAVDIVVIAPVEVIVVVLVACAIVVVVLSPTSLTPLMPPMSFKCQSLNLKRCWMRTLCTLP
jgi:hypothetical protein